MLTVVSGRILVVDDDADWAHVMKRFLTLSGNEVVAVETGFAALQAMEEEDYDIIVIDVLLPGASGIDLIPSIRAAHPQTAIYIISGDSSSYSAARALQLGAERCIDKSIEPAALQEMVGSTIEHRHLMKSLHEEKVRFEQLIENAPIGVFAIDLTTMRFTYANRFLLDLTGFTLDEAIGLIPMDFVIPEDRERLLTRLRARIEGNALPPGEKTIYRFINKGGTAIDLQIETHIVDVGEERFVEGTARDVTTESRLSRLQEIVIGLGRSILSSRDIDQILQSVLDAITAHAGFQRAVVFLYDLSVPDPQKGDAYKMLSSGLSEEQMARLSASGTLTPAERELAFDEQFRLGDAYYIPHDRTPWRSDLGLKGSVSIDGWDRDDYLFIPLRGASGIIGHISVDDPLDRSVPTVETLKPVVALANLAALAVERTYRFRQLEKQKRRLHGLTKFSRELAGAQDVEQMCDVAAKRLRRDMNYEFFGIWIREGKELVMAGYASQGNYSKEDALYTGLRMPVSGTGFARWALEHQKEIIVPDVQGEERYLKWSDLTRSEIDVPILARKEALGVIAVESSRVDAFGEQDQEIITALASQLSVAITNLQYRTFLLQIQDLADMLVGATSLEELVESTLDFLREQFAMQQSAVLLREGEHLVARGIRSLVQTNGINVGDRFPAGKGIVGWVMEHKKYALVNDVHEDRRYVKGFRGICSELAVPVMIADNVLGVMNVESPQVGFFDEEDRRLLAATAAQFAVALSNLEAQSKLRDQAVRDPLTHLFNRQYLNEVIDSEFDRADRYGREITLMMMDIDGFRRVNNTLGHLRGDKVLQKVAQVLSEGVRAADSVIRYGGDEFLILMPETVEDTGIVKKRLKKKVEALPSELELGNLKIGLSIGIYIRQAGDKHPVEEVLAQADQRMYADKRENYAAIEHADDYRY